MPKNLKISFGLQAAFKADVKLSGGVYQTITANAANVIVRVGESVEPLQAAAQFDLLNFARFGQNFEVAVDSPQTDAGQSFAHHFINFIGAGMRVDLAQFLEDNLPLAGHPQTGLILQQLIPPGLR